MGVRERIKDGVAGTARSIAKKGLQLSSKTLDRTSKKIQDIKSKVDERAHTLSSEETPPDTD